MTDELEQMSLNQRRAVDKALSALETFAAIWAAEIRLGAMSARIAAVPSEAERAKRIAAMIEQGFIEGAYRHYLDHKDKCDELEAARATAEQRDSVDAKRYRMVRQGKALTVRVPVKDKHVTYCIGDKPESGFPEAFDEAIDAAIESQRSGDGS